VKQRIVLAAAVALFGLAPSGALHAQIMQPYGGFYPGMFGGFPPREIAAIVRSKGLEPLSRPVRQGGTYTLRAADPTGRVMQVTVDARMGRIMRITPAAGTEASASAPYPPPLGGDRPLPDVATANSRVGAMPYPDDDFEPIEQSAATGAGTSIIAPRPVARALPPPLPRPRPNIEANSVPAASASAESTPAFTELEE
jgi:hypothetical protein